MRKQRFFTLTIAAFFAVSASAQSLQKPGATVRPSLDLLVSRIESYWKYLAQKKKAQASQYVMTSDRDAFLAAALFSFAEPRFKSVELSSNGREATATVIIKRVISAGLPVMELPLTEAWRFEKGNWYRRFQNAPLPFADGTKSQMLSPEQAGDLKKEIQRALKFEKSTLDFGTVGDTGGIRLSLKYTLSGDDRMPVRYKLPPEFGIQGLSNNTMAPGQQELILTIPTWNYDGDVKVPITLIAYRQGIEVPFEFLVKGTVYIPVSVSPKVFRLDGANPEQEILVRNNSKSDVELVRLHTETGRVSMAPMPVAIPAGQQVKLKAKLAAGVSRSMQDNLSIPFAKPVDSMGAISLQVLFSTEEKVAAPDLLPADASRNCRRAAE
jgi:hypothetical protein